ncbi:transketolase C-terminal domain-containing protein, partial [Mesorhizobium sp.]
AASGEAAVTIFASGSEVEVALGARDLLEQHGHPTRVVSVPCFELFEQQSEDYRSKTIGNAKVKVAIEAGIRQSWDHIIGSDGIFVGMTGFGASGTIEQLYPHFGITAEAAAKAAEARLHGK